MLRRGKTRGLRGLRENVGCVLVDLMDSQTDVLLRIGQVKRKDTKELHMQ